MQKRKEIRERRLADRTIYQAEWVDYASMKADVPNAARENNVSEQAVLDDLLSYLPQESYFRQLEFPSLEEAFSWAEENYEKCLFHRPRVSVVEITKATRRTPEDRTETEAWYVSEGEREPIELGED